MASSTKFENLPTEILDLIANENLDINDAENLRQASKQFRDVVDLKKDKWKCVNYIKNANNLTERCENGDFSEEEKICQRKHNLCGPLNVKASVSLPQVTVPYGTTWVGKKTFSNINIRRFHIVLPKTVKNIDTEAFKRNTNVVKVSAPGVEKVQDNAFVKCTSLEVFEAPKLKEIGKRAFGKCALKSFHGPLVTSIGHKSFYFSQRLKTIKFPTLKIIENDAFSNCESLQTADFPKVLGIGERAFNFCLYLRDFKAPQAQYIDDEAFGACESLQTVDLPQVREIYGAAFTCCDKLEEFQGPLLEIISAAAFEFCPKLKRVYAPEVYDIGYNAFSECYDLEKFNGPRLKHIGSLAFLRCKSLETVWAPFVRSIEDGAFQGCLNLRQITISEKTEIGKDAIPTHTKVIFIENLMYPTVSINGYTF
tara:strand:- start:5175 stop:6446 length:1272 start_codon:yes stop_codon:yes gene_type:complete